MSDEQLGILIAAIPTTIASITAAVIALAALRKGQAVETKADTIIEKAVEIHTLTDGNLSQVSKKLEVALARIDGLQDLVKSQSAAKAVADRVAEFLPSIGVADIVNGVTNAIDRAVAAVPPNAPDKIQRDD